MLQIYLPIAEVSVDALVITGLGAVVGLLSGMFGVGGGFLITPLLFFIGIPPGVAVATGANQVVASSISGVITHFRRGTVDLRMGNVLLAGGILGSLIGIWLFNRLQVLGQLDLFVQLTYVGFLGIVGALMMQESLRTLRRQKMQGPVRIRRNQHLWLHRLPLKYRFRASGLYISVLPPVAVGIFVGIMSAVMGVGGGFLMVPAMIYLLGMPTKIVVGTSLYQIIFTTAFTVLLHSATNHSVDLMLGTSLILGGVVGAQVGTRLGLRLKAEQLRVLLAGLVLLVSFKLALDLVLMPEELYSVIRGRR